MRRFIETERNRAEVKLHKAARQAQIAGRALMTFAITSALVEATILPPQETGLAFIATVAGGAPISYLTNRAYRKKATTIVEEYRINTNALGDPLKYTEVGTRLNPFKTRFAAHDNEIYENQVNDQTVDTGSTSNIIAEISTSTGPAFVNFAGLLALTAGNISELSIAGTALGIGISLQVAREQLLENNAEAYERQMDNVAGRVMWSAPPPSPST